MFFKKKSKGIKCEKCSSFVSEDFSYCPYCSNPMLDVEREMKDFGMIGKNDSPELPNISNSNLGITDRIFESVFNSLMKQVEKQFKESAKDMNNIQGFPGGIRIRVGPPMPMSQKPTQKKAQRPAITEEQIEKMSNLPRAKAKTHVRRLSDKVVYELAMPGIESVNDVFVSKLEKGYEIKAIGKKKVYVNSLPVELPIKSFKIDDKILQVEFHSEQQ